MTIFGVETLLTCCGSLLHYSLGILDGEYSWWMKYSCHAVPVDGQDRRYLLNRYWSGSDKPRPEMYAQDYLAGTIAGNRSAELFSEIAATAEVRRTSPLVIPGN